jgi:hypothetical protein
MRRKIESSKEQELLERKEYFVVTNTLYHNNNRNQIQKATQKLILILQDQLARINIFVTIFRVTMLKKLMIIE